LYFYLAIDSNTADNLELIKRLENKPIV